MGVQDGRAHDIATTHGVWVAFASFAGDTGSGYAPAMGRSQIRDPRGELVVRAGTAPNEWVAATLA